MENDKDDEKDPSKISTPRLIIDQYSISTGEAVAGQSFEVKLGILNTHKYYRKQYRCFLRRMREYLFRQQEAVQFTLEKYLQERVERTVAFDTKFDAEPKSYSLKLILNMKMKIKISIQQVKV